MLFSQAFKSIFFYKISLHIFLNMITLSSTNIVLQPNQTVKNILLTNATNGQANRPIMYKIKTNKIDYVDAKPSCGYISALKGQNQISVIVRSLINKKDFTAKLQILYVSHEKITEQLVARNKHQFDMNEYNQLYDTIKKGNQNDVKTAIITVTKKTVDPSQEQPVEQHTSDSKSKIRMNELFETIKVKQQKSGSGVYIERGKVIRISLMMLLIGILIGYLIGSGQGDKYIGSVGSNKGVEEGLEGEEGERVEEGSEVVAVHINEDNDNDKNDDKDKGEQLNVEQKREVKQMSVQESILQEGINKGQAELQEIVVAVDEPL